MSDRKDSTNAAMLKYHQKQLNQQTTRERKGTYKKPEKNTEKNVLLWARSHNIHLHVVESSSYDPLLRRKGMSRAAVGFPDLVGNTQEGHSLWIELKAKDRRSTLSDKQREFLLAKIQQNCFAVVVDSVERLAQYWKGYWSQRSESDRQSYLSSCLPKKRQERVVENEFGF